MSDSKAFLFEQGIAALSLLTSITSIDPIFIFGQQIAQLPHTTHSNYPFPPSQLATLFQKFVLVTGANHGIGYEAVKAILESSKAKYHVFLVSRFLEKGRLAIEQLHKKIPQTNNTVKLVQFDVTNDESIHKTFEKVEANPGRLDAFVNNADAAFDSDYITENISLRDCFNKAYAVNVTGATIMTHVSVPLLLKSSDPRLLFVAGLFQMIVASEKYFPTPPLPAGWSKKMDFETIGYRLSKTALNMVMLDWKQKLKKNGVKMWAVGPGFLATNFEGIKEKIRAMGGGHPSSDGKLIRSVVKGERDADAGKIVGKDGAGKDTLIPFWGSQDASSSTGVRRGAGGRSLGIME